MQPVALNQENSTHKNKWGSPIVVILSNQKSHVIPSNQKSNVILSNQKSNVILSEVDRASRGPRVEGPAFAFAFVFPTTAVEREPAFVLSAPYPQIPVFCIRAWPQNLP
jgi:hypothetical protein